jgi:bla regulator protein blaR1
MITHIWQSTLFAGATGLLTLLLKRNRARTRFWVWFIGLVKFLVPFAVLVSLGSHLTMPQWAPKVPARARAMAQPAISFVMGDVALPAFTATPVASGNTSDPAPTILLGIWACGFVAIASFWIRRWMRVRAAVRLASKLPMDIGIRVVSSPEIFEPGVFGIFRPFLILPDGIAEHLSKAEWEAILAHEICHVRCRDNLTAVIYMVVESLFWFHPLVWWMGTRLVAERERACDEEVLRLGSEPRIYAEGILKVCELYLESPLQCVAGVTGADLRQRIEAIMTNRIGRRLNRANKFLLACAGVAAVAVPLTVGIGDTRSVLAQSPAVSPRRFDVASIKANSSGENYLGIRVVPGGGLRAVNATLRSLIREAYQVRDFELSGGPAWLDSARYDIEAKGQVEPGSQEQTGLQIMKMLQALLADRFQLRIHRETKDMPIYALLVAKNGPKLEASRGVCFDPTAGVPPPPTLPDQSPSRPCGGFNNSSNQMLGASVGMSRFAANLSRFIGRTVVDRTGLNGTFDVALRWTPYEGQAWLPTGPPPPDDSQPSIFSAVQEQLGLRLESQRGPVEVLVIDRAEKPSEN